jgi:hypothetical protein
VCEEMSRRFISSYSFQDIMAEAYYLGYCDACDLLGEAVTKTCQKLGIPCTDTDVAMEKVLEIRDKLNANYLSTIEWKWVEVPAHRILVVPNEAFRLLFDRISENGELAVEGEVAAFMVRKKDGRRFRRARFFPADSSYGRDEWNVYLEEL